MELVIGFLRPMLVTSRPDARHRTRTACIALAAALASAGCGEDHPTATSIRSDMGAAVLMAVSAAGGPSTAPVHYELHSRCGPDDAALDGLTLLASTPSLPGMKDSAVLDRMVEALSDSGLQVERFSEGPQYLRASPDGDSWALEVTRYPDSDGMAIHARGVVDDEVDVDATAVITQCG